MRRCRLATRRWVGPFWTTVSEWFRRGALANCRSLPSNPRSRTKRTVGRILPLCLTLGLTGCSLGQVAASPPPKGPYQIVHVTAQNWHWTLSTTHLKMGETVEFVVRSVEGIHGFSVMGTNISTAVSQGDAPSVIYWTPPARGVYTLACNVYCGAGHDTMQTLFSVK